MSKIVTAPIINEQILMPFVPLGEIADVKLGKMLDRSKHKSGRNLPYLRNINIRWGHVDTTDVSEMFFKDKDEEERYSVRKDDVLVCEGGEPGRAALWTRQESELKFQKALHRVRFRNPYEPRLLVYYLEWAACRGELEKRFTGSTIKHLTKQAFVQLPVPNPPLPKQRRIVARIEEIFSRLDAGVAALHHAKAQLQRYRQSVLAAAVTGQLTQSWREQHPNTESAERLLLRILEQRREEWSGKGKYKKPKEPKLERADGLAKTWACATIDQLGDVFLGKMLDKSKHTEGQKLPYLRNINIRWGKVDVSDLSEMYYKDTELERYGLRKDDLLVCEGGEPGRAAVWDGRLPDLKYQKALHRVRLRKGVDPKFVLICLERDAKTGRLERRFTGSTIKHFTRQAFIEYDIPLPPLAEQHQIVAEVEARTTAIDHLEAELDLQITRANRLRQSTLAAAFSGKL